MQNASATTAGMTKKQEVKEPKKSFGGALGSMIAGGSYGLGMADMFTGSEATKAMWGGVKGALGGGGAEAAGGIGGAAGARLEARFPKQSAAELFLWQMGERLGGRRCITCRCGINGECRGAAAVSGATTAATEAAALHPPPDPWDGDFWRPELWPGSQATCCKEVP